MNTNKTTNIELVLPSANDYYDVEIVNENNIKIDEHIGITNKNVAESSDKIDFNLLATLGIEYGGILNNTNAKVSGKAYYDTTGKKLYKCIANTSVNYADASYFVALSNNDLLGKLQNLITTLNVSNPLGILVRSNIVKVKNHVIATLQFDTGNKAISSGSIIAKIEDITFTNNLLVVTTIGDGTATNSFPANSCHIATNGIITIEFNVSALKRLTLSFTLESID